MFESNTNKLPTNDVNLKTRSPIQRLTAFWAFSEAGLGGVLHITRLPFKGILIAGAATLFITLIGQFSKRKGNILKSTVLVIIVKFLVSPHTPITAAIAVFIQGLAGELFFFSSKLRRILIPTFSIFIQFINAVQKILIITILFGQNFWITVDDFANSILNQFISVERIEFSYLIIIIYISVHVAAGLLVGLFILKLIKYLDEAEADIGEKIIGINELNFSVTKTASKKRWFQKPSGLAILFFFLVVLGLSFFLPDQANSDFMFIILMIIRAIIILTLWYFLLSPLLRKILTKILSKHKSERLEEIDDILQFFPILKQIVFFSWNNSKSFRGIKKIKTFIFRVILYTLYR
jgi:hypothetical protein